MCLAVLELVCFTGLPEVHAITNMDFVSFALKNGAEVNSKNQMSPFPVIHLPGEINDPLNMTALLMPFEKDIEYGLSLSQLTEGCGCDHLTCMCSFVRTFSIDGFTITLNVSAIAILNKDYSEAELLLTVNGYTLIKTTIPINLNPICVAVPIPIPLKVNLCAQLFDFNFEKKTICVKFYVEINIFFKTIVIDLASYCFHIPTFLHATSGVSIPSNAAPSSGELVKLFEMLQLKDYSLISPILHSDT